MSDAVRSYADMVSNLYSLVGLGLESEVELLQRKCRSAWQAVEQARLALYRHEANHSCNRSDFRAGQTGGDQ